MPTWVPSATSFPYSRKPGRAGSGQLSCTSYTVPNGAIPFWKEHFDRHQAEHSGVQERFGTKYLRVRHPAGLLFEVIEEAGDHRNPWMTKEITRTPRRAASSAQCCRFAMCATRNRSSLTRSGSGRSASMVPTIGPRVPAKRSRTRRGLARRSRSGHQESWGFGAGTAPPHRHSMSKQDRRARETEGGLRGTGLHRCVEIKDRFYFHSMYVRSPGGILVECTANVPGGFFQDEAPEELGTKLHLPPWFEAQREAIVAQLEAIVVPEENRPGRGPRRCLGPSSPVRRNDTGVDGSVVSFPGRLRRR